MSMGQGVVQCSKTESSLWLTLLKTSEAYHLRQHSSLGMVIETLPNLPNCASLSV